MLLTTLTHLVWLLLSIHLQVAGPGLGARAAAIASATQQAGADRQGAAIRHACLRQRGCIIQLLAVVQEDLHAAEQESTRVCQQQQQQQQDLSLRLERLQHACLVPL